MVVLEDTLTKGERRLVEHGRVRLVDPDFGAEVSRNLSAKTAWLRDTRAG